MQDPRPLVGEPLSIELVNTRWPDARGDRDLLDEPGGARLFLEAAGFGRFAGDDAVEEWLRRARDAIAGVLADPTDPAPVAALNAVLARGALVERLEIEGPARGRRVDPPECEPAWTAAHDLLDLLRASRTRIRRCDGPGCVLHFYDTSKNGTRRWCSMAGCGNRAKARRNYARRARPSKRG